MKLKIIAVLTLLITLLSSVEAQNITSNPKIDKMLTKYSNITQEDLKYANAGANFFGIGDFNNSVICLKHALNLANDRNAPKSYRDSLKMKLAVSYINAGNHSEGQKLLKEIHGLDIPSSLEEKNENDSLSKKKKNKNIKKSNRPQDIGKPRKIGKPRNIGVAPSIGKAPSI